MITDIKNMINSRLAAYQEAEKEWEKKQAEADYAYEEFNAACADLHNALMELKAHMSAEEWRAYLKANPKQFPSRIIEFIPKKF